MTAWSPETTTVFFFTVVFSETTQVLHHVEFLLPETLRVEVTCHVLSERCERVVLCQGALTRSVSNQLPCIDIVVIQEIEKPLELAPVEEPIYNGFVCWSFKLGSKSSHKKMKEHTLLIPLQQEPQKTQLQGKTWKTHNNDQHSIKHVYLS